MLHLQIIITSYKRQLKVIYSVIIILLTFILQHNEHDVVLWGHPQLHKNGREQIHKLFCLGNYWTSWRVDCWKAGWDDGKEVDAGRVLFHVIGVLPHMCCGSLLPKLGISCGHCRHWNKVSFKNNQAKLIRASKKCNNMARWLCLYLE